jgi:hypothetical protein
VIITVLWEDQRGAELKGFGPHELLLSCLADDLATDRWHLVKLVESHPKKGNANVRKTLQKDGTRLASSGFVFAVIDRDKVRDLWEPMPPDCMTGISTRFREDASGNYELVFLVDNVESVLGIVSGALGRLLPPGKPRPDDRDRILAEVAWAQATARAEVRERCPSFDRLVKRVASAASLVLKTGHGS